MGTFKMEMLRLIAAGSVDDGKSTLIGRLLHDSHAILEDELDAVTTASTRRGFEKIHLALLTDGLRAERDKNITIDVAHRYFRTSKRMFVLADCPGHFQYIRNMATAASTADVALVLVDASKSVTEQTRRHCFIASLLKIRCLIFCINKMDLVGYRQNTFLKLREDLFHLLKGLEIPQVDFIPVAALGGDNIVDKSIAMPWYKGPSVLETLEEIRFEEIENDDFRLPIQTVLESPNQKLYAGLISSGQIKKGDTIVALPSGAATRVMSIEMGGRELPQAGRLTSVALRLEDEIPLRRGDMLVSPRSRPRTTADFNATLFWMNSKALEKNKAYILRHTTAERIAEVSPLDSEGLGFNEIAGVTIRTNAPLYLDPYGTHRATGSFILIDETGNTMAAGMVS